MKAKLGFIGAGVMASAILEGVLAQSERVGIGVDEIVAYDPVAEKCAQFAARGIAIATSEAAVFGGAETVILAVKPQAYRAILAANRAAVTCQTVVSIMAGVTKATLEKQLPDTVGIVRVMPNMCLRVGKGICAVSCNDRVSEGQKARVFAMFSASGEVLELDEGKFDAVTAVSGSGPAYIFYVMNAMVQAGVKQGLSEEESRRLALATTQGAAVMAKECADPLPVLVERVCSKGGTTIEAIRRFDAHHLSDVIAEGMDACKRRSEELSREMAQE